MRLHRVPVLGEHRALDARDHALVGEVDALDLELDRLLVEQVVQLLLGELLDRLVGVEEAAAAEDPAVPALHAVAGHLQRPFVERERVVVELAQVEVGDGTAALTGLAHAADPLVGDPLALLVALLEDAGPLGRGDVEGEGLRRADVGLADPAVQDPQQRVRVGDRPHGRAGVAAEPVLVDQDRGGDAVEQVDLGPGLGRHEALHEGRVGLVDQPLRLGRNRPEDERTLSRAGNAGEGGQPPLGDLDVDVAEIVDPRSVDADRIVAVCFRRGRAWLLLRHGWRGRPQPRWLIRIRLPAGSRMAQSRIP